MAINKILPISILICTNNRPKQLTNCLKSIFHQICLANEVIIVDSSSKLLSQIYFDKAFGSNKVRYITSSINSIPRSRNILLNKAKNELCLFVDDDVELDKCAIANCYKSFKENPSFAIIGGIGYPKKTSNIYSQINFLIIFGEYLNNKEYLKEINFCPTMIFGFNKSIFLKYKIGFNEKMKNLEDVDICLALKTQGEKIYINNKITGVHEYRCNTKDLYSSFYNYYLYAGNLYLIYKLDYFSIRNLLNKNYLEIFINVFFGHDQKLPYIRNEKMVLETIWVHSIIKWAKVRALIKYNNRIVL